MTGQVEQVVEQADDWVEVGAETVEVAEVDEQPDADHSEETTEESEETLLIGDDEVSPASDADEGSSEEDSLPEDAPNWAKDLRQKYKEAARELKQLKAEKTQAPKAEFVPDVFNEPMPDLEDSDVDYDKEKLAKKMASYLERKNQHEAKQAQAKAEQEKLVEQYQVKLSDYNERKQKVAAKFPDFAKAEQKVIDSVPIAAQNALLMYADSPELIVLAAGRSSEIRAKLASLANDPVALGVEIGKLSKMVKAAPKAKAVVTPTPQIKAGSTKPVSADESRFKNMFPDAIIR